MNCRNVKTTVPLSEPHQLLIFLSGDTHCHLFLHHTPHLVSLSFTSIHFPHFNWILIPRHLCSSLTLLRSVALFYVFSVFRWASKQGLHWLGAVLFMTGGAPERRQVLQWNPHIVAVLLHTCILLYLTPHYPYRGGCVVPMWGYCASCWVCTRVSKPCAGWWRIVGP